MFVLWKREPPKPVKAPPRERPVDALELVAVVPPKLFRVNPVEAVKNEIVRLQKETSFLMP